MYLLLFPHLYRVSWYNRSFIYSPNDALVSCLKNNIKIYIQIYTKTTMDYIYCNFSKHELMRSLMLYIT